MRSRRGVVDADMLQRILELHDDIRLLRAEIADLRIDNQQLRAHIARLRPPDPGPTTTTTGSHQ